MVLSDRIVVMRAGRLQQIGPPMEVYRDPANLFVASFIGSPAMNFLEVETGRDDGALHCRLGDQVLRLPAQVAPGQVPDRAIMGVRPTDLMVGGDRGLQLQGEVFLVEPIGPVTYVDCNVAGTALKALCDPDRAPAVGDRVVLDFAPGRVHLFDPQSEQRL